MDNQTVFKRYEYKYILTKTQREKLSRAIAPYIKNDRYGKTTIRNIYFDTDNYRLIRTSVEHPIYKEKLRVRSYNKVTADDYVFVELKKKYDSVVYKRRICIKEKDAKSYLCRGKEPPIHSQITDEIDYFCHYYKDLAPKMFLSYEREAFYSKENEELRITFDENILWRDNDLSLGSEVYGFPVLNEDKSLMEIKTEGGIPLWLVRCLSEEGIFKTSFSKYGRAYSQFMMLKKRGEMEYAHKYLSKPVCGR